MQAANLQVERAIQRALADESTTELRIALDQYPPPPLNVIDARRIITCLRENARFVTLTIRFYDILNPAVLNVFINGLPLCTSITSVNLDQVNLGNEGLERLLAAFYNTSIMALELDDNGIQGQRGGEVIRDFVVGNNTILELGVCENRIGPEGAGPLGQGLASNNRLQKLCLQQCNIGNTGLANWVLSMGETSNSSLTDLDLGDNDIEGAEGGRQVTLLLQCFSTLNGLDLSRNHHLGPLGARALAPGLAAAAIRLEELDLSFCGLGNDGVANLVPDGQVNRSLTRLGLGSNNIQGRVGGENVVALATRCTNLHRLDASTRRGISTDQRRRLDLLLDRKRLCTTAQALAGSPFPILFRAVEEAHRHEHGLSAIFIILQNDGDDYFCNANNRTIE